MSAAGNSPDSLDFTRFFNVIGGNISDTPKERRTTNPSTLDANPQAPLSTQQDVDRAINMARNAAPVWAAVPWEERARAIERFADAIEANAEELSKLIIMQQGKPPMWAQHEISLSVQWLREFCRLSPPGDVIEDTKGRKVSTRYTPLGIVVGIVPWNFSIHLKVAEIASNFFPAGVIQALSGDDNLGPWLTQHPDVNMVSFTGSAGVGKRIMESCSKTLKRVTLELGGNDAAIVCADVDPTFVASKVGFIAFANAGQICIAVKRVYVHESVYEGVLSALVAFIKGLKVGIEVDSFLGPLSTKAQYDHVKGLLEDIKHAGLTIATAGTESPLHLKGYFLDATIVENPPEDSRIVVEEQFGPILPVMKWTDEHDVIQRVNATEFGLGASIWTRDLAQADRMASQLQAGNIWVNCHAEMQPSTPFSGHKQSGLGVEMGSDGLKAYCNVQSVYVTGLTIGGPRDDGS
ncbi:hypothetical protein ONZ43_g3970 [Nemania bipapillata]|uniref:Uncharacterized protein n=1 Tax=Nemania bipapillata TaxID=110536 RepID=A0ACC2ITQ1_9PEZI|nr:hypothetical protein ONZ43_g3970 [Nemania bipapillata]